MGTTSSKEPRRVRIGRLSALLMLMLAASVARAQQAEPWPVDGYTAEEIEAMPWERFEALPVIDFMREKEDKPTIALIISLQLRTLYFFNEVPTDRVTEELVAAIKAFQAALGEIPDGTLSMGQWAKLSKRAAMADEVAASIGLPAWSRVTVDAAQASAEGTWVIDGEAIAYPINVATAFCVRVAGLCWVFQAEMVGAAGASRFMDMARTSYIVRLWTASEVVSEYAGTCRATTMILNAATQEAIQITRNTSADAACPLPALARPSVARLVDGTDVALSYYARRREEVREFYAPAFRAVLDRLR